MGLWQRSPRRLALTLILFLGWMSWIAYLAVTASRPIVLSRPQLLVAQVHAVATLDGAEAHPKAEVTLKNIVWSASKKNLPQSGQKLTIEYLERCGLAQGWAGPGDYILALSKKADGSYQLTATPPTGGFVDKSARWRIYPVNEETLQQLHSLTPK